MCDFGSCGSDGTYGRRHDALNSLIDVVSRCPLLRELDAGWLEGDSERALKQLRDRTFDNISFLSLTCIPIASELISACPSSQTIAVKFRCPISMLSPATQQPQPHVTAAELCITEGTQWTLEMTSGTNPCPKLFSWHRLTRNSNPNVSAKRPEAYYTGRDQYQIDGKSKPIVMQVYQCRTTKRRTGHGASFCLASQLGASRTYLRSRGRLRRLW